MEEIDYNATLSSQDMSSLSEAQDKALSLAPVFSGLLSAVCSATIIHMVLISDKKTSYRRILLGLSASDLVSGLVLPLQSYLLPSSTSQRIWASGNEASCTAMGFFQQLSLSNVWYNGMLSFYFLLTVRYGVREFDMARRYEPWMHVLSLGFPLITASIGAGMGVYDEFLIGHGCWITNYPKGCGCMEEGQEDNVCCMSPLIAWIFAGLPALLVMLAIIVNNLLVFCHVRGTLQKSRKYLKEYRSSAMRGSTARGSSMGNNNRQSQADPHAKRIHAVAVQGFLYVAVFFVLQLPTFILRVLESQNSVFPEDEARIFPILLLQGILWPLQGFFNLLIYIRPSYKRARADFPNESRLWAFRRALHGAKIQPTDEPENQQTHEPEQE